MSACPMNQIVTHVRGRVCATACVHVVTSRQVVKQQEATRNKCIATNTSNKCLTSSNKKLVVVKPVCALVQQLRRLWSAPRAPPGTISNVGRTARSSGRVSRYDSGRVWFPMNVSWRKWGYNVQRPNPRSDTPGYTKYSLYHCTAFVQQRPQSLSQLISNTKKPRTVKTKVCSFFCTSFTHLHI